MADFGQSRMLAGMLLNDTTLDCSRERPSHIAVRFGEAEFAGVAGVCVADAFIVLHDAADPGTEVDRLARLTSSELIR
jgi:hypothetical protein